MTDVLVGIDCGTSSTKAVALDLEGRVLASARRPMRWITTPAGVETEPDTFLRAALGAAHDLLDILVEPVVAGIGICGIGETGVLCDERGMPIGRPIAWHDGRGAAYARLAAEEIGESRFSRTTGMPTAGNWSLYMYRWLREHEPAARTGVHWQSIPDWIVRRLGGEPVNELSQASRTGLLDVRTATVSTDLLEWAQAPPGLLRPPVPAGAAVGRVGREFPRLAGATLTVAGHDHLCACVGAGATGPGELLDSCGTAEAVVTSIDAELDGPTTEALAARGVTTGRHVLPHRRAMLSALFTGVGLNRVLAAIGRPRQVDGRLDTEAVRLLGTPLPVEVAIERDGTAHISPIRAEIGPVEIWCAAAQAAAEITADLIRGLGDSVVVRRIVAAGGWARSAAISQAKRARLPGIEFLAMEEPGARGAGLLAGVACGAMAAGEVIGGHPTAALLTDNTVQG